MSYWMCCNSCFLQPSADRKLAVTNCGHVICNACYQKGKQGTCLICNAKCEVSPLSDKVIMFQARHQKRLLAHYQQRNEKLEEVLVKMKQEMQQMTKKLNEQSAYIAKLENSLQHQSTDNMEVDERSLFRKPNTVPRLSLISPPQDGRMGTVPHRSSNQNTTAKHSTRSATVSFNGGFVAVWRMSREGEVRLCESFTVTDFIHLSRPFTVKRQLPVKKLFGQLLFITNHSCC
ncbi:hypothetical protein L3Q82_005657 [Scortum barcoo]|uniref:Uncharacterized protein n=1 Tax=Scortum barcoo TaxID=214431 RepID=A0ACB8V6C5_9TELE|nr:hypothetical protein L3Q82_005657 [Scortum barcoo]